MEITCKRCHEAIGESDRYCATCGLPQLVLTEQESAESGVTSVAAPYGEVLGSGSGIAWRPALEAALLLALPAGVLSAALTPVLALVWVMGAAAWAVSLYARRSRTGPMSMAAGARIGLVTGLFTAWLVIGAMGVSLWTARFVRHQGAQFDAAWVSGLDQGAALNQQRIEEAKLPAEQAVWMRQMAQSLRGLMLSPEGRAGAILGLVFMLAGFHLIFATLGGMLGARFVVPRRRGIS